MNLNQILILLFCVSGINLFGQVDTDVESLLENISMKYKKYSTSKIDMNLIIELPESDEKIDNKGIAWLKDDMFKIDFEDRMIVSNTKDQWTYLKEVNEVQISNYDPSLLIFLPSKIFDAYSEEYVFRIKEEFKNSKGELIKMIELSPKDKELAIFKIIMSINTKTMEVIQSEMFEKSGMRYTYQINHIETSLNLEDSFFSFDPKEYEIDEDDITDLR